MRPLAVVAASALLLATGCTLNTDYFSDYRGRNLLGNYDFNAMNGATAKWTTTTVGLNASVATNDLYMTFAQATDLSGTGDGTVTSLSVGPDGTSPAYRLEIKNLMPDGDFEAEGELALAASLPGSMTTNGWALVGAPQVRFSNAQATNGAPSSPVTFTPSLTIHNRSMLFTSQSDGDTITVSLDTALGGTGGGADRFWQTGQYRIRFDYYNASNSLSLGLALKTGALAALLNTDAENGGDWLISGLTAVTASGLTRYSVSRTFTVTAVTDTRTMIIGKSASNARDAAIIDNVRVVPANLDESATMQFSSLTSGSLKLLPGSKPGAYQFTLRVHDDPTADEAGASGSPVVAHAANRMYPSGITITVRGKAKNSPGTKVLIQQFVARPGSGWTTWTTITLNGGLDFVDTDADLQGSPALQVSLTPTNVVDTSTAGKDVGSLLVSQPTLTFNP